MQELLAYIAFLLVLLAIGLVSIVGVTLSLGVCGVANWFWEHLHLKAKMAKHWPMRQRPI